MGQLCRAFFSIKTIDEKGQKYCVELANSLKQKGIELQKELYISLVYDECLLGNFEVTSYFTVLPIKTFLLSTKNWSPEYYQRRRSDEESN